MHAGAHEIGQNIGRAVGTRTLGAQAGATRSGTPDDPAKSPVDHASTLDRLNAPDRARVDGAAGAAIAPNTRRARTGASGASSPPGASRTGNGRCRPARPTWPRSGPETRSGTEPRRLHPRGQPPLPHPAPGEVVGVGSKRSEPAGVRTADNRRTAGTVRRDQYGEAGDSDRSSDPRTRQPGSGSWVTDPTSRHVVRVRRCGTPRQQPETPHGRIVADGPEEKQPPEDYRDGTGADSASRGLSHERRRLTYGIAMWARMCVWPSDGRKVPRYPGAHLPARRSGGTVRPKRRGGWALPNTVWGSSAEAKCRPRRNSLPWFHMVRCGVL